MPHVNTAAREIILKIVYYGPGLGGKTTNVKQIYERLRPADRGRLMSLNTSQERTLFFDLLPIDGERMVRGQRLRYHVYTVPGQVYYNTIRRMTLRGVDGIVFVADSHPARLEANEEAMQNMYDNLAELEIDPDDIPLVIQYNKRDVRGALPEEVLQQMLNPLNVPAFRGVASEGIGVLETLQEICRQVERKVSG